VQIDASQPSMLAGRGPYRTLVAAIDDATNAAPAALCRPSEDAHGYCLLLHWLVTTVGRPLAMYHDRQGIFPPNPKRAWSGAEQLAGQPAPTPFAAQSPQAKGRIERLFGTVHDRLVIELRLAGAATRAETNQVRATFLPTFNARFRVPATAAGTA
jgi:hypothetical protein